MERRRLAPTLLFGAIVASCIPHEVVEVPVGIEWIATVPADHASAGRLRRARAEVIVPPDAPGWMVGFTTERLVQAGLPEPAIEQADVRVADDCAPRLAAEPTVLRRFGEVGELPALTSARLTGPELCGSLAPDDFLRRTYEVPDTLDAAIVALGRAGDGRPLMVLDDGNVIRLTERGWSPAGSLAGYWPSALEMYRGVFWWVDYGILFAAPTLEPYSSYGESRYRRSSIGAATLYASERFGLLAVSVFGAQLHRVDTQEVFENVRPGTEPTGPVQLIERGDSVWAAGPDWSWRWDGVDFDRSRSFRPPFAVVDGAVLFGDMYGGIHVATDGGGSEPVVFVPASRETRFAAPIQAMATYRSGALVGDFSGYVSWVQPSGELVQIAHVFVSPIRIYVAGTTFLVVSKDINTQLRWSGLKTNVTVDVFELKN